MSGFSDVKDVTLMVSNMPSKKCIPAMCIDPFIKKVLPGLPDEDLLNTIRAFLGNPEKNEEIFLPKQCLVNLLLERQWGASKKYKALEYALMQGHVDIVECLLDNGATIRGVDKIWSDEAGKYMYQTPLSIAIEYGHLDLVKHLVEKRGASIESIFEDGNMTPLMYAVCNNRLDIVQYLVEEKEVNIDTSFEVRFTWYNDYDEEQSHNEISTALIHAVKNNHLHIVQYLVEKGAKINDDAFSYINPVVFAADLNNTEIVKCLVENGADFISWELTREYETPANSALKRNNQDMIEIFVEKKIISKDEWYDIIYRACYYHGFNNHKIMQYLHYYDVGMNKDDFDKLIEQTNDDWLNSGSFNY